MATPTADIGEFLRTRRARLKPADLGLTDYGRSRRVPGLRREELARLAGVSVAYYTRLEQGNGGNVSAEVLDAIATALRLTGAERAHLRHLARPGARRGPVAERQEVRPDLVQLLSAVDGVAAYIWGHRGDVLAWNRAASGLFGDWAERAPRDRNWARITFLDPASRTRFLDWEAKAADVVGQLRWYAGRRPDDPLAGELVAELLDGSDDFRRLWAAHDVKRKTHGGMRIRTEAAGELTVHFESFALPGDDDQSLTLYHAEPGSPSEEALRMLTAAYSPNSA
ncbi:helix-turn-helix domain-containing protein [Actinoplanes sp. CA-131856]